jgi:uncharacterized protein (TIGR03437 family)
MRVMAFVVIVILKAHSQIAVTTYRNNLARSGENLQETILTPSNVTPNQFGKLFSQPVDGQVYAQPLYLPSLAIPGKGIHNVVFIATAHDTVYAFDADSNSGPNTAPLWQVSLAGAPGERPLNVSDVLGCTTMTPEIGITATPVIDKDAGTLFVVAVTIRDGSFVHRLHALDIATGRERAGSPAVIDAFVDGTGDGFSTAGVPFHPYLQKNRAGLLLVNGVVYTAWTSHCDTGPYHGWIIGYDAKDLHQVAVFNSSPNGWQGSFWMGGAAPAADPEGNMYVVSGNGIFNADTNGTEFGDSILKLSTAGGLTIADYFTPFNQLVLNRTDTDLGSGGAVLLPDSAGSNQHSHLLISAGKEGRIYLLDRDQMGHFNAAGDSQIVQSLEGAIGPLYGSPAYFNNTVYFAAAKDTLKAFSLSGGKLGTTPVSQSSQAFYYPGAIPTISADGTSNGIVWLVEGAAGGTLHAYDAANVANELYNSQMNASRDSLGSSVRFIVPTVADGKVYVGTGNAMAVFGLLNQPEQPLLMAVLNAASLQPGPVAPGSLVSIFGRNLAQDPGGVTVSINGIRAPLQFISPEQINTQVPSEIREGTATAELRLPNMPPAAIQFAVASTAPGIFAAVKNADGTLNSPDNPAAPDSLITVYLTGQGAGMRPIGTSAPPHRVSATVGSQSAEVVFAERDPASVGVFEVRLRIPTIGAGSYPLVIAVGCGSSNARQVTVSGN